ncbi:MAG: hypothetical protein WCW26_05085 [Candidatus Buchananbacteria bacterium]
MKNRKYLIFAFTLAYLAAFTANALVETNYEFLYYTFLVTVIILIVTVLDKQLYLDSFIVLSLSVLGFLHFLGGNLYFADSRLYNFYLIPNIFRYDNLVHTYGSFIATLALYSLLSSYIDQKIKKKYYIFASVLMLMAMGLGTIVELVELSAVIFLNAGAQVGGYYNNAFDLFFNTIGAGIAVVVIYFYQKREKLLEKINEKVREIN